MAKPELTKVLLAQTIKKLAALKPLDKISIGDIANAASISRKTFYYHFIDKQELICWVFLHDAVNLPDKKKNNTSIEDFIGYLYSEKEFYKSALTSDCQNSLQEYMFKACAQSIHNKIILLLNGRKLDADFIRAITSFVAHGFIGALVEWAREGAPTNEDYFWVKDGTIKGSLDFIFKYPKMYEEILELIVNHYVK
jgi:probable dihydroxyacetone kinase regulator